MSIFKHDAIRKAHPEVVTIRGEECFDKFDNPFVVDDAKVKVEFDKLNNDFDSKQYQRDRQNEFNSKHSIGDQLDYIFHNGIAKWKTDVVQPVKDKFPKP